MPLTYLEYADRSKFDITVVLPEGSLLKPHLKKLCVKLIEINAMSDQSLDWQAVKKLTAILKRASGHCTFSREYVGAHRCKACARKNHLHPAQRVPPFPAYLEGDWKKSQRNHQ